MTSSHDNDRHIQPPGPTLQRLNARLHEEPLASIVSCIYWICLFVFALPVTVVSLVILTTIRVILIVSGNSGEDAFDPRHHEDKQLAVVITGCDTGFGKELAILAAQSGFFVFAGCLKKESFQQFETLDDKQNVRPLRIDVTSDVDVKEMTDQVKAWLEDSKARKKRVLHALVNNAGIGFGGDIDWFELEAFQKTMDVNYFGIVRCCKALLPILKEQSVCGVHKSSRIINLASCAGLVAGGTGLGLYSPSKHAAVSFSSILRREIKSFNIQVTTVNPSFHGTDIVHNSNKAITNTWNKLSKEKREEFGEDYFEKIRFWGVEMPNRMAWKMEVVVDQMLKCLKKKRAPPELLVGADARFGIPCLRVLPAWALDLCCGPRPVPAVMRKISSAS